ncbi:serine/threonine-protein kinase [Catenuloplanes atrovinosus]|uniref:non-specific serine/threonine protein kinase n=1 Tax=Catenuloplanes atrovinosus TaxID=137266 RepID=A0AAE3YK41_9ACTN|nr:protein kinase [Catenuloplanes atrovinosus]MDR7273925.1 serine/threonine-protein kinase [Catenuloplanes atrovinosus]
MRPSDSSAGAPATDPAGAPPPRQIGGAYALQEEIGGGATGTVWRALESSTGEQVAIKLLRDDLAGEPKIVMRFVQERAILRMLRHPHIVPVRELLTVGPSLGLVMDLIPGGSLRRRLRVAGTLPPAEAAVVLGQTAAALSHAHRRGVVHRDLKPDNILLTRPGAPDPTVRLTDFGVARVLHGTRLTTTGAVIGTPSYLAPEVIAGGRPTPAADVYALGVVLFELLLGRPPFAGVTPYAALSGISPVRPPSVPPEAWHIIESCLAGDPSHRPTAAELIDRFRHLADATAGLDALDPLDALTGDFIPAVAHLPRQAGPSAPPAGPLPPDVPAPAGSRPSTGGPAPADPLPSAGDADPADGPVSAGVPDSAAGSASAGDPAPTGGAAPAGVSGPAAGAAFAGSSAPADGREPAVVPPPAHDSGAAAGPGSAGELAGRSGSAGGPVAAGGAGPAGHPAAAGGGADGSAPGGGRADSDGVGVNDHGGANDGEGVADGDATAPVENERRRRVPGRRRSRPGVAAGRLRRRVAGPLAGLAAIAVLGGAVALAIRHNAEARHYAVAAPATTTAEPRPVAPPPKSPAPAVHAPRQVPTAATAPPTPAAAPTSVPARPVTRTAAPAATSGPVATPEAVTYTWGPTRCESVMQWATTRPAVIQTCYAIGPAVRLSGVISALPGASVTVSLHLVEESSGRTVAGPYTCPKVTFTRDDIQHSCGGFEAAVTRGRRYAVVQTWRSSSQAYGGLAPGTARTAFFTVPG